MKKIISLALALVMVLSLSATVFAVGNGESSSTDVKATYNSGADAGKIYSVDITWSGMSFTYTDADTVWDPATHTYVPTSEPYWSEGTITVTNHSNDAITATAAYAAEEAYKDIAMTFSAASVTVATADNGVDGAAGTAVTETITVKPEGALAEGIADVKIGTITITIS